MGRPKNCFSTEVKLFSSRLTSLVNEKKSNGLTQKEVAAQIGVSSGSLAEWCNGRKIPTIDSLIKMAKYFEVPADYILGRMESPRKQYMVTVIEHLRKTVFIEARSEDEAEEIAQRMWMEGVKMDYDNFVAVTYEVMGVDDNGV